MKKYKCIYTPTYRRNSGYRQYRITKGRVYKGEDKGNGFILITNNNGDRKCYHKSHFEEVRA